MLGPVRPQSGSCLGQTLTDTMPDPRTARTQAPSLSRCGRSSTTRRAPWAPRAPSDPLLTATRKWRTWRRRPSPLESATARADSLQGRGRPWCTVCGTGPAGRCTWEARWTCRRARGRTGGSRRGTYGRTRGRGPSIRCLRLMCDLRIRRHDLDKHLTRWIETNGDLSGAGAWCRPRGGQGGTKGLRAGQARCCKGNINNLQGKAGCSVDASNDRARLEAAREARDFARPAGRPSSWASPLPLCTRPGHSRPACPRRRRVRRRGGPSGTLPDAGAAAAAGAASQGRREPRPPLLAYTWPWLAHERAAL